MARVRLRFSTEQSVVTACVRWANDTTTKGGHDGAGLFIHISVQCHDCDHWICQCVGRRFELESPSARAESVGVSFLCPSPGVAQLYHLLSFTDTIMATQKPGENISMGRVASCGRGTPGTVVHVFVGELELPQDAYCDEYAAAIGDLGCYYRR